MREGGGAAGAGEGPAAGPARWSAHGRGAEEREVQMGSLSWGKVAGIAALGLAAAGATYFFRTERGRKLLAQARDRGQELWLKARHTAESASEALQETTQPALTPGQTTEEPAPTG